MPSCQSPQSDDRPGFRRGHRRRLPHHAPPQRGGAVHRLFAGRFRLWSWGLALLIHGWWAITPLRSSEPGDTAASTYDQGVSAFENEDFGQARSLFAGLVEAGHLAPEVFYNLGNAFYRLDDPGAAALQFRRAILLSPRHVEARQNLRFLRREYGFVEAGSDAVRIFTNLLDQRTWIYLAVGGGWLVLISGVGLITLSRNRLAAGIGLLAGLMLAGTSITALVARSRFLPSPSELAVVTSRDARALTAPAPDAGMVIDLPPGSAVRVLEQRGNWDYVEVDEGTRGWVQVGLVEPLWPFDPALLD